MAGFISKRLFRVVQSVQTASLLAGGRLLHPLTKHTHFSSIGEDPDSHSDFKPVNKAPNEVPSACKLLEKDVKENPVMIFMKGVPDAPRCGFSALAVNILKHYGVAFSARNILEDPELKESVKAFSHWPTFPQVFINGQFVGGSDIILDMHKTGELKTLLENAESSEKQN